MAPRVLGTPAGPVAKPQIAFGVLPMTILYPAPAPVKCGRPFGAGILPPAVPRPDRPYEPSAADRQWWAAASARLESRRSRRPAWIHDRSHPLAHLPGRAR